MNTGNWKVMQDSSGHWFIYDETGNLRGQYRDAQSLAEHLVFAIQEIDALRNTSPVFHAGWDE